MGEKTGVLEELQRTVAGLSANLPNSLTPGATHASQVVSFLSAVIPLEVRMEDV